MWSTFSKSPQLATIWIINLETIYQRYFYPLTLQGVILQFKWRTIYSDFVNNAINRQNSVFPRNNTLASKARLKISIIQLPNQLTKKLLKQTKKDQNLLANCLPATQMLQNVSANAQNSSHLFSSAHKESKERLPNKNYNRRDTFHDALLISYYSNICVRNKVKGRFCMFYLTIYLNVYVKRSVAYIRHRVRVYII